MKHNEKSGLTINKDASMERKGGVPEDAGQLAFFADSAPSREEADAGHPASSASMQPAIADSISGPTTTEWRLLDVRGAGNEPEPARADAPAIDLQPATTARVRGGESLGRRLTAAREARGWSCKDVAEKLHLPLQVVNVIESEQYERIGYGVYLRGYLTSYARLVNVPVVAVENVLRQHASTPQLVVSGQVSHSRYLIDRYSGSALYVVLTGLIVVPFVMFAMNMGGDVGARLTPLDASAPVAAQTNAPTDTGKAAAAGESASASTTMATEKRTPATAADSAANDNSPLMASLAPLPNSQYAAQAETPQAPPSATSQLRLSLSETSWVEIVDADGKRLEYATLPAGTVKTYASDKPLDVRLGNTNGATVEVNGVIQDITPYNRGNVAHFKVLADGRSISHTE